MDRIGKGSRQGELSRNRVGGGADHDPKVWQCLISEIPELKISKKRHIRSLAARKRFNQVRFRQHHRGIPLADSADMATRVRLRFDTTAESVCLLRWIFHKGGRSITCQLEANRLASSYEVGIVPHWDVASAVVESAQTPLVAFRRHAEMAMRLRAAGWSSARRSH